MTDLAVPDLASLPPMDVPARLPRLRAEMETVGVDALLVTNLTNIRYLTGFTGSAALLLVTGADALFVTDGRYTTQSQAELDAAGVDARIEVPATMAGQRDAVAATGAGCARIGLEADDVTWAAQQRYASDWFAGADLVPPTWPSPGCGTGWLTGPPRPSSPSSSTPRCDDSGPPTCRSRRSWRRVPTPPVPTTGPADARSATATSSSWTSALSWTATTPT